MLYLSYVTCAHYVHVLVYTLIHPTFDAIFDLKLTVKLLRASGSRLVSNIRTFITVRHMCTIAFLSSLGI